MAVLKINDFDPNYHTTFGGDDIKGRDVYTHVTEEKIGTVDNILVDEHSGKFRYLLVDLGIGHRGKKVLLPVGRSRTSPNSNRVYASLSKEQADQLPELEPETNVDYDYEERVRGVYRADTTASSVSPVLPLESSASLDAAPLSDASNCGFYDKRYGRSAHLTHLQSRYLHSPARAFSVRDERPGPSNAQTV